MVLRNTTVYNYLYQLGLCYLYQIKLFKYNYLYQLGLC